MSNSPTLSPADDKGVTGPTGRRVAAHGVITRHAGRQVTSIVGETRGIGRATSLAVKGDTRRQAAERIAGGAR